MGDFRSWKQVKRRVHAMLKALRSDLDVINQYYTDILETAADTRDVSKNDILHAENILYSISDDREKIEGLSETVRELGNSEDIKAWRSVKNTLDTIYESHFYLRQDHEDILDPDSIEVDEHDKIINRIFNKAQACVRSGGDNIFTRYIEALQDNVRTAPARPTDYYNFMITLRRDAVVNQGPEMLSYLRSMNTKHPMSVEINPVYSAYAHEFTLRRLDHVLKSLGSAAYSLEKMDKPNPGLVEEYETNLDQAILWIQDILHYSELERNRRKDIKRIHSELDKICDAIGELYPESVSDPIKSKNMSPSRKVFLEAACLNKDRAKAGIESVAANLQHHIETLRTYPKKPLRGDNDHILILKIKGSTEMRHFVQRFGGYQGVKVYDRKGQRLTAGSKPKLVATNPKAA